MPENEISYQTQFNKANIKDLVLLQQAQDGIVEEGQEPKTVATEISKRLQKSQRDFVAQNFEKAKKGGSIKEAAYWTGREFYARVAEDIRGTEEQINYEAYNLPETYKSVEDIKNESPSTLTGDETLAPPAAGLVLTDMFGDAAEGPATEVNAVRSQLGKIVTAWTAQKGEAPTQIELKNLLSSTPGFDENQYKVYSPYLDNYQPPAGT